MAFDSKKEMIQMSIAAKHPHKQTLVTTNTCVPAEKNNNQALIDTIAYAADQLSLAATVKLVKGNILL